jgi:hypothetical protein
MPRASLQGFSLICSKGGVKKRVGVAGLPELTVAYVTSRFVQQDNQLEEK